MLQEQGFYHQHEIMPGAATASGTRLIEQTDNTDQCIPIDYLVHAHEKLGSSSIVLVWMEELVGQAELINL